MAGFFELGRMLKMMRRSALLYSAPTLYEGQSRMFEYPQPIRTLPLVYIRTTDLMLLTENNSDSISRLIVSSKDALHTA